MRLVVNVVQHHPRAVQRGQLGTIARFTEHGGIGAFLWTFPLRDTLLDTIASAQKIRVDNLVVEGIPVGLRHSIAWR